MTTDLPIGTVTFHFTDIGGSTQLWERQPEAMRAALAGARSTCSRSWRPAPNKMQLPWRLGL